MKLAFDPSARLTIGGSEQLVEAVLERLEDGELVMHLHDDEGNVVTSISLRADFLVRVEHAKREAAA